MKPQGIALASVIGLFLGLIGTFAATQYPDYWFAFCGVK